MRYNIHIPKRRFKKFDGGDLIPLATPIKSTSVSTNNRNPQLVGNAEYEDYYSGLEQSNTNQSRDISGYTGAVATTSRLLEPKNTEYLSNQEVAGREVSSAVSGTLANSKNPVIAGIGAISAVGKTIGRTIDDKSRTFDEQGNITGKFARKQVAASLLDPIGTIGKRASYKGGFTDFSGKKYKAHLEGQKKEEIAAENERQRLIAEEAERIRTADDAAKLNDFNKSISPYVSYFGAMGGKFITPNSGIFKYAKGAIMPTSSDSGMFKGDRHGQDTDNDGYEGIPITNNNQIIGEVEGNEGVRDMGNSMEIYSDRIKLPNGKTIAEEFQRLSSLKGKKEKELESSKDAIKRITYERELRSIDKQIDDIFDYQQSMNGNSDNTTAMKGGKFAAYKLGGKIPKYYGGEKLEIDYTINPETGQPFDITKSGLMGTEDVGTKPKKSFTLPYTGVTKDLSNIDYAGIVNKSLPFINYMQNRKLMKEIPEIPAARLATGITRPVAVNVNPYIQDAKEGLSTTNRAIESSALNSGQRLANKQFAYNKYLGATGDIRFKAQQEDIANIEKQKALNKEIELKNLDTLTARDYAELARKGQIRTEKSTANAYLINTLQNMYSEQQLRKLDDKKMRLLFKLYEKEGVLKRAEADKIVNER